MKRQILLWRTWIQRLLENVSTWKRKRIPRKAQLITAFLTDEQWLWEDDGIKIQRLEKWGRVFQNYYAGAMPSHWTLAENVYGVRKKLRNSVIQIERDASKSVAYSTQVSQLGPEQYKCSALRPCSAILKYMNSIKCAPAVSILIMTFFKNMLMFAHLFSMESVPADYRKLHSRFYSTPNIVSESRQVL